MAERREALKARDESKLDDILTPPLLGDTPLSADPIQHELDNNVQSDRQNTGALNYRTLFPECDSSETFLAASDLIFLGTEQPSGYTEPVLHARRRKEKARI